MWPVSSGRTRDSFAAVLAVLAGAAGIVSLGFRPFLLEPIAVIVVLAATLMTNEHRKLIAVAVTAIGLGFVIGASIAVAGSHPLY